MRSSILVPTVAGAIQAVLIRADPSNESLIKQQFQKTLIAAENRMKEIRADISKLPHLS